MVTTVEYIDKEKAEIVREHKTLIVERVLGEIVKTDGKITPQALISIAMHEEHPLHKYFEWDDTVAAERYRIGQATSMIIATKFVCMLKEKNGKNNVVDSAQSVRKFLPTFKGEGFKGRSEVLENEDTRRALIERKKGVLRSWCASVIDIEELSEIREQILALIA